ncbi:MULTISPECIES: spore germination protein [unclassified Virgibacillus]|uniref:spore germination protein n=1 Tax=unclassified Virgibacillus TaxID=2620237 RepID=UPI0024DEFE45|nr:spore germination protein [Virgibacillus sp. LDC-1]
MNFMPMYINLFAFKTNTVDRASAVGFGPNQQLDLFVSTKRNQGIESMGDWSPNTSTMTNIMDSDLMDALASKGSVV